MLVHDLSPFAVRFNESWGIRWYGLSYLFAFLIAYIMVRWLCVRQKSDLPRNTIGDLITTSAIGVLVGGRLGYCLFYAPDLLIKFKSDLPFWGVLALNEGGMSSHGGMIGLTLALIYFSFTRNVSHLYLLDLASLTAPLGIFFGRIANFLNGELVGRVAPAGYQYAVKFPQDILFWPQYQMNKLGSLATVIEKIPGMTRESWLEWVDRFRTDPSSRDKVMDGLGKILDAIQTGNLEAKNAIAPLLEPRYPAQLFAAFGEGLFIFLFLLIIWYRPQKPGIVGSWFLILYSVIRIYQENYRLPDAHIGFDFYGLTRGQWLSSIMLILGVWLLFFFSRRSSLPVLGWGLGQSVKIHRRN